MCWCFCWTHVGQQWRETCRLECNQVSETLCSPHWHWNKPPPSPYTPPTVAIISHTPIIFPFKKTGMSSRDNLPIEKSQESCITKNLLLGEKGNAQMQCQNPWLGKKTKHLSRKTQPSTHTHTSFIHWLCQGWELVTQISTISSRNKHTSGTCIAKTFS